ncbi:ABC-type transport auxiliary lipoprotein family protein [Halomonas sp. H10-9-1]|uniref:PqiC family protein n=1 Tax=Halomonas sp. H10-9-1 TaxID=2950871 RepID=UPI0032DE44C5
MKARRWIVGALTGLLLGGALGGCASNTPAPERYTLPAAPVQDPAGAEARHQLLLAAPRLAHYLDVDGIVMQVDDITLVEARQHQWAEALGRQLQRALRDRLASRLPDTRVMLDEPASRETQAQHLVLEVDRFQGRHDGQAVIGGHFRLYAPDGNLLAMHSLDMETVLAADGYPALVRALGRGWDDVADRLATAIEQARPQE